MAALRFRAVTAIAARALLTMSAVVMLAGCSARIVLPAAPPQARDVRALLWPTTAALGRSALQPFDEGHDLQPQVGSEIREQVAFSADPDRVDALLRELHAVFADADDAPAWQAQLQLEVVPHPLPYTLRHNSNHKVAAWLRAVGATVTGSPALGRWRIAPPEQPASTGREDEPSTTARPDPNGWTQAHGRMTRPTGYTRR